MARRTYNNSIPEVSLRTERKSRHCNVKDGMKRFFSSKSWEQAKNCRKIRRSTENFRECRRFFLGTDGKRKRRKFFKGPTRKTTALRTISLILFGDNTYTYDSTRRIIVTKHRETPQSPILFSNGLFTPTTQLKSTVVDNAMTSLALWRHIAVHRPRVVASSWAVLNRVGVIGVNWS